MLGEIRFQSRPAGEEVPYLHGREFARGWVIDDNERRRRAGQANRADMAFR